MHSARVVEAERAGLHINCAAAVVEIELREVRRARARALAENCARVVVEGDGVAESGVDERGVRLRIEERARLIGDERGIARADVARARPRDRARIEEPAPARPGAAVDSVLSPAPLIFKTPPAAICVVEPPERIAPPDQL
jgi:hypothetical protein